MTAKREDHLQSDEEQARRSLENHGRRWPTSPNVFYILLLVVLAVILLNAL